MGKEIQRYEFQILDCAQGLHEHNTGSADPMPPEDAIEMAIFLSARMNDWYPASNMYDAAVRGLCLEALREYTEKMMCNDVELYLKQKCKDE